MGELAALSSAVLWALTALVMRPISGHVLLPASLVRMLVGSALLVAVAGPTGALGRVAAAEPATWLWLAGSVASSLVVGDSLFFLASARIGVARALPIASAFPLFSTAGAALWLQEPVTLPVALGTVLVVAGVGIIAGDARSPDSRRDVLGVVLAVLAALSWAATGLALGPALEQLDPLAANVVRFPLGAAVFGALVLLRRPAHRLKPRQVGLAALAGVGTVASALMFLAGIAQAGVARGVLLSATSPIFGALLAAWLLREPLSRKSVLGIGLSCLGALLLA